MAATKKTSPAEAKKDRIQEALAILREDNPEAADLLEQQLAEKKEEAEVETMFLDEKERQRREKHFWIQILPNGDDDTETHCYVGAAGADYIIEKNVRTPVPESVLKVLDSAVREGFVPLVDHTRGIKGLRKVYKVRYPYQLRGEASHAEVKAWYEKQAEKVRRESANYEVIPEQDSAPQELNEMV